MIANINTGNYLNDAFHYNLSKVKKGEACYLASCGLPEGCSLDEAVAILKWVGESIDIEKPVFHTSLSFADKDVVDDAMMIDIAKDYMQRLGYGNTPYLLFRHEDTHHPHVHILGVNVEYTQGKFKKVNDSFLFLRSMKISREIEKEYGLVVATDQKQVPQLNLSDEFPKCRYGEKATTDLLREAVLFAQMRGGFVNFREFNAMLAQSNVECRVTVDHQGGNHYRFYALDKGARKGISATPNMLGLNFTQERLEQTCQVNAVEKESLKQAYADMLKKELEPYLVVSPTKLSTILEALGLESIVAGQHMYWMDRHKYLFSPFELKIPPKMIQDVVLEKAHFSPLAREATAFRKEKGIFHESRFLESEEYMHDFLQRAKKVFTPRLNARQFDLLIAGYLVFKEKNLDKIREEEYAKDRKFIAKTLDYTNRLNLPQEAKYLFMQRQGVFFEDDLIKVTNSVDAYSHSIDNSSRTYVVTDPEHPKDIDKLLFEEYLNSLTATDKTILQAAINGKQLGYIDPSQVTMKVMQFLLPQDLYLSLASYVEQFDRGEIQANNDIYWTLDALLHSVPGSGDQGLMYRKKKRSDDDEEEDRRWKRKQRRS